MGSSPMSGAAPPGPSPCCLWRRTRQPGRGALTCSVADTPGRQLARRGAAVEHAHVVGRQELHELGVVEGAPACSGRWRPLGQRCTGFSRSPGTQPQQTCPRMENTTLVRPGWRGLDRSPFPEGRESGPTDGKGAGRVKGLGKPWAPLLSPDEDNSASPLTYIGVPGGYYLKKHIRAPSPKGTPAVLIPCSCHLLRLLGTELPGVQPG